MPHILQQVTYEELGVDVSGLILYAQPQTGPVPVVNAGTLEALVDRCAGP